MRNEKINYKVPRALDGQIPRVVVGKKEARPLGLFFPSAGLAATARRDADGEAIAALVDEATPPDVRLGCVTRLIPEIDLTSLSVRGVHFLCGTARTPTDQRREYRSARRIEL